jgi:hypothetical protein
MAGNITGRFSSINPDEYLKPKIPEFVAQGDSD